MKRELDVNRHSGIFVEFECLMGIISRYRKNWHVEKIPIDDILKGKKIRMICSYRKLVNI